MLITKKDLAKYSGQRKHGKQLSTGEKEIIWKRLRAVDNSAWKLTSYAQARLDERNIDANINDVVSTIHNSYIVEYRIIEDHRRNIFDVRVVLRSNEIVNNRYNLNVVFSLSCKSIVTLWLNDAKDDHKTLRWEIYNKDMKVFA